MSHLSAPSCRIASVALAATVLMVPLPSSSGGIGLEGPPQQGDRERVPASLSGVVLLDATSSAARIMAPFVWDGTRDNLGQPDFSAGRRLGHRPMDLYMPGIVKGLLPHLEKDDRLRFASFSRIFRLSRTFSGDPATLERAARDVLDVPESDRDGPSPIWDAVGSALTALEPEPGRRVIILVTDGISTGNRASLKDVTDRAAASRVGVFVVHQAQRWTGPGARIADVSSGPWAFLTNPFGSPPAVTLRDFANRTGGGYLVDDSPSGQYYRDTKDGRYYPDPENGRPRGLIGMFKKILDSIHGGRQGARPLAAAPEQAPQPPVRCPCSREA